MEIPDDLVRLLLRYWLEPAIKDVGPGWAAADSDPQPSPPVLRESVMGYNIGAEDMRGAVLALIDDHHLVEMDELARLVQELDLDAQKPDTVSDNESVRRH